MTENTGALIDQGPSDWQIVQQDDSGQGALSLSGRWVHPEPGRVEVRLVREDTGIAVCGWQPAQTSPDHTWSAQLSQIPAGGLYRLETRLNHQGNLAGEWSIRGDSRHFLGVGDLWLIAGQSNSAGYGRGPYHDPPQLGVHLFRNSEAWALAAHPMNDATDTRHPVNRETANPGHSPYLHFGRILLQALGHPIGLVQTALGGSPLSAWNPAQGQAVLYENMVHCAKKMGGRVRGILWYQGESDTGTDADAASYAQRFAQAVAAWRGALGDPQLPVLTVQLNRVFQVADESSQRRWTQVREAQRQVARADQRVAVVPALDLPLSDLIHISPAGNLLLGERLARAALGLVYGRPGEHRAPDLQAARKLDPQTIELSFAPVTSRMDTLDLTRHGFRVEDVAGEAPITRVIYSQDARVQLHLTRPLRGRALVHGGWGYDPGTTPWDMERFLPMLGFYGAEIS
ncbi:MAG: sialate O-acetylesterase [Candidatus Handelsmanbacteria bacterium]|nr:sialate O-acetylesterase [Candidatus Handelsmanbacteria bacterium]